MCRNPAVALAAGLLLATTSLALDWKAKTLSVATAPFQTTQDVAFEFKNNSGKSVTILDIETSCDCLDATADLKVYAPGATGAIKAKFTVGDRIGLYERVVTVVTDEPDSPVRLIMKIDVPAVATLEPARVAWQVNEASAEKSVELTPAAGIEIVFSAARVTNAAFTARLETVVEGKHYRLQIKPGDTSKPISAAIRIFGRDKDGHDVVLSAYADIQ